MKWHASIIAVAIALVSTSARADKASDAAAALLRAYPGTLEKAAAGEIVAKSGVRIPIGTGHAADPWPQLLDNADILDMFAKPYAAGKPAAAPRHNDDPGRARSAALFNAMYGDCTRNETAARILPVQWLPKKGGGVIRVTSVNGVDKALAKVSKELDDLPASFDRFLLNPAGGYVCRPVAGSKRPSAHGWGIAVDIAAAPANYWLWDGGRIRKEGAADIAYRNAIPHEIVEIFERHGFIWGGKWYHYDTMHFEYRPELLLRR